MNNIKKSFDKSTPNHKIDLFLGSVNFCSWERLLPHLIMVSGVDNREKIIGVIVDKKGLQIIIK